MVDSGRVENLSCSRNYSLDPSDIDDEFEGNKVIENQQIEYRPTAVVVVVVAAVAVVAVAAGYSGCANATVAGCGSLLQGRDDCGMEGIDLMRAAGGAATVGAVVVVVFGSAGG